MANPYPVLPDIKDEDLLNLAEIGATYEEMAKFFKTTPTWLSNNKRELIDLGRTNMHLKLRRKQLQIANDDTHKSQHVMLIFLGKAILGQREISEVINRTDLPPAKEFEMALLEIV
jgi:hypothetical protein